MVSQGREGGGDPRGGVLFTAFEPSGDCLAAPVIETLLRREPGIPIWAFGGPRMEAAGATLIERTTDHAVMLVGALGQAKRHYRRLGYLKRWLADHPIAVHVPVDSPAANWSICRLVRRHAGSASIVHLAAPQVWAWGAWRVRRLRRLTDRVLCLLPFEPRWFDERRIPAVFVGHPLFDEKGQPTDAVPVSGLVRGSGLHLALLPGSRKNEITANAPMMVETYRRLRADYPELRAVVAVGDEAAAARVDALNVASDLPTGGGVLEVRVGETGSVLDWCDVALVVSGTATLQTAAHRKPMVALFRVGRLSWHLVGRWVVRTRPLTLPNLISKACGRGLVIDELVPHVGGPDPVFKAVDRLLRNEPHRAKQIEQLEHVASRFQGYRFADTVASSIFEMIGNP